MPHRPAVIRYLWAAPNTALGLLVVAAGLWHVRVRVVDGVIEAHGPILAWMLAHLTPLAGGISALTLGHVVVARDDLAVKATRGHERVHVRQHETWGPLFLPAYLAASLAAVMRGRHFYFGNRFELEAFAHVLRRSGTRTHSPAEIVSVAASRWHRDRRSQNCQLLGGGSQSPRPGKTTNSTR